MRPMDDQVAQILGQPESAPTHPEEMKASVDLRIGDSVSLRATARATPAGFVAVGIMVSAVVLAVTALVWAVRRRH